MLNLVILSFSIVTSTITSSGPPDFVVFVSKAVKTPSAAYVRFLQAVPANIKSANTKNNKKICENFRIVFFSSL